MVSYRPGAGWLNNLGERERHLPAQRGSLPAQTHFQGPLMVMSPAWSGVWAYTLVMRVFRERLQFREDVQPEKRQFPEGSQLTP